MGLLYLCFHCTVKHVRKSQQLPKEPIFSAKLSSHTTDQATDNVENMGQIHYTAPSSNSYNLPIDIFNRQKLRISRSSITCYVSPYLILTGISHSTAWLSLVALVKQHHSNTHEFFHSYAPQENHGDRNTEAVVFWRLFTLQLHCRGHRNPAVELQVKFIMNIVKCTHIVSGRVLIQVATSTSSRP